MKIWLLWFIIGEIVLAVRFPLASMAGMMTPTQMQKSGIPFGIPLTGHGSTWFVIFLLTPLLALFISEYSWQWTQRDWLIAASVGLVLSGLLHWSYTMGKFPEADVRDGQLEPAGWVHFVYMSWAIMTLVLVYGFTKHHSPALLCTLTVYMVGHIWVGNHFPNRIVRPQWFPPLPDYPFWAADAWAPVVVVAVVLGGFTWWNLR